MAVAPRGYGVHGEPYPLVIDNLTFFVHFSIMFLYISIESALTS